MFVLLVDDRVTHQVASGFLRVYMHTIQMPMLLLLSSPVTEAPVILIILDVPNYNSKTEKKKSSRNFYLIRLRLSLCTKLISLRRLVITILLLHQQNGTTMCICSLNRELKAADVRLIKNVYSYYSLNLTYKVTLNPFFNELSPIL